MMDTLVQTWNDLRDFVFAGGSAGTEVTRSHSWPWGPSVTMLLLAAAAGWVIYVYVRERGRAGPVMKTVLASLRIALIVLVVFLLYGWMLNRHRTDLPDLVLLIDDSASMATIDDYRDAKQQAELTRRLQSAGLQQPARVELAKLLLLERDAELLRQLEQRYRLKVYRVGGSARALCAGGVDTSGLLAGELYGKLKTLVMVSATLAVEDNFDNFISRSGLGPMAAEGRLSTHLEHSPFDYQRQAALYVVDDMPEPSSPKFNPAVVEVLTAKKNSLRPSTAGSVSHRSRRSA
mgnify:CR=1 FL=1